MYPGAQADPDHDGDKDADVQLGFGEWKMRVQVAHFNTSDDRDKVLAFYRKSLSRYGDVLECRNDQPVGSPVKTAEGLTCSENDKDKHVNVNTGDHGLTLRAGSKRHQHIFAIKNSGEGTRFALVELQLPAALAESSSKTSD
jgi:hypothetical protein